MLINEWGLSSSSGPGLYCSHRSVLFSLQSFFVVSLEGRRAQWPRQLNLGRKVEDRAPLGAAGGEKKKTKVERKCEIIICMKGENDEVSALIPNKKMNEDQNSQRSA